MATNVHLTQELEIFARSCVDGGKYNNVSEVVRAGLRALQEAEERRKSFNTMLENVRGEAQSNGVHELDDVLNEMDAIIDKATS